MKKVTTLVVLASLSIAGIVYAGMKCSYCNGTGWRGNMRCMTCGGDGEIGN